MTWFGAFAVAVATCACNAPALATNRSVAKEARTVRLVERARLKLSSEKGATITEHGEATGTYRAPIVAIFTIRPKSVIAHVTIYPTGGSITGSANANYKVVNNLGYFGGTFTLGHCTGKYAHLAEINHKPLGISGIINRYNFETVVKANGEATGF
jgi:hypothetical protein